MPDQGKTQDAVEPKLLPAVVTGKFPESYAFLKEVQLKPDESRIALYAELLINDQPVPVRTGDIGAGEFYFYLARPATIGSLNDACQWINKNFGSNIPDLSDGAKLKEMKLPTFLEDMIVGLANMKVSVEGLIIDSKKDNNADKTFFHIEICAQAREGKAPPLGPLTFIKIQSIGFMVTKATQAYLDQKLTTEQPPKPEDTPRKK